MKVLVGFLILLFVMMTFNPFLAIVIGLVAIL